MIKRHPADHQIGFQYFRTWLTLSTLARKREMPRTASCN